MSSTSSSSSSSPLTSSSQNDLENDSESRPSQVSTSTRRSQVGTSTPSASTSFPCRDALGEIKDEAEDKFDEDTWFSADEKRNKMTKESIVELLEEFPLPPPFSTRVPTLQNPANYGTVLEISVYEGQIRSGYRVPMHPFAVAFFDHYKMAPSQLMPNGWRKLVGLIYLVQTSGYPLTVHDFMRLYLEVCFIKNVANSVSWYYIHNRVRVIKGGPKSNKAPSSRGVARDKLILENQPHEAFAMAHVQPAYNAYCYSSQMQDRFAMAMDVACNAETDKRTAEVKADKLDKEVKNLKMKNTDLLAKLGRLEKRCEKLRHDKAEIGNKAIQAFLDGTAGEEWLRKRTEDGLSIFEEGFQKAKELTTAKYPSLFLDDIVLPTFETPSGETAAPIEAGYAISPREKSV
ncbi:hypothetical protein RJ639_000941 [Escallonia herrerae]|uniref:Transposase (putative) gypsy type domain-containing protein n=1 Tax=Escallonia herrerae TaxID=1293975 RepID=A0AA89BG93_9ASTE|nr:hypothetical protein RJ639_000941 [Escallonia herrerae]